MVVLSCFCLAGCVHPTIAQPSRVIAQTYDVARFHNITIDGPVNIVFSKGHSCYLKSTGRQDILCQYQITQNSNEIFIKAPKGRTNNYTETFEIGAPSLYKLTIKDGPNVLVHKLKVAKLNVITTDKGDELNTYLHGQFFASYTNILQYGRGKISIAWLSSGTVDVLSFDCGTIWLAGQAKKTNVILHSGAYFDGKYFRTDTMVIEATDKSQADIFPQNFLKACTWGQSAVYYYQWPKYLYITSKDSSNVLLLKDDE